MDFSFLASDCSCTAGPPRPRYHARVTIWSVCAILFISRLHKKFINSRFPETGGSGYHFAHNRFQKIENFARLLESINNWWGQMRIETSESARHYVGLVASLLVTLVLVGCGGLGLLPSKTDVKNTSFKSYKAVEVAYQQIAPGDTRTVDLGQIGFDPNDLANVEILSYLGVIERFIPRELDSFRQSRSRRAEMHRSTRSLHGFGLSSRASPRATFGQLVSRYPWV